MSARGAADFLTRATTVLATLFVTLSVVLAVLAATRGSSTIDTSLTRTPVTAPAQQQPAPGDDASQFSGAAREAAGNAAAPASNSQIPLAR